MPKTRKPPKLAAALLRWFGPDGPALAGDLAEGYQAGQSRWWYWRQTFAAVAAHVQKHAMMHPFHAIFAVLFGWGCVWGASNYVSFVVGFDQYLFETGLNRWFYLHGYGLPMWIRPFPALAIWKALAFAVGGYSVGKSRHISSVVAFGIAVIVGNVVTFINQFQIPHSYPLAQLIIDLLILYPTAALGGGLFGVSGVQRRRVTTS